MTQRSPEIHQLHLAFSVCLFNCYASLLLCVFESQDPVKSFRLGLLEVSMCLLRSVSVSLVAAEVWLQLVRISSPGKCWTFPEFPLSATYSLPPSRAAWHDPTLPAPEGISQNVYSLEPSLWFVCDCELSVLAGVTELTFCFSLLLPL